MNKPFLKWAGSKRSSIDMLKEEIDVVKDRFIEPFVGSAVVSLNVDAKEYLLADINSDLINLFINLKEYGEDFIKDCKKLFSSRYNNSENFYDLRNRFNIIEDVYEKSTIFLYLNRHAFNGLCRYNSSGKFNVPFGKYKNPYFPEKEMLFFYKKSYKFKFLNSDFEKTIRNCKRKTDVFYCDPPYVPLSKTASFTDYNAGGFTQDQQLKLAKFGENSKNLFLISNHDTDFTREIYKNADKFRFKEINRYISARVDGRKSVNEILAIYNPLI